MVLLTLRQVNGLKLYAFSAAEYVNSFAGHYSDSYKAVVAPPKKVVQLFTETPVQLYDSMHPPKELKTLDWMNATTVKPDEDD